MSLNYYSHYVYLWYVMHLVFVFVIHVVLKESVQIIGIFKMEFKLDEIVYL